MEHHRSGFAEKAQADAFRIDSHDFHLQDRRVDRQILYLASNDTACWELGQIRVFDIDPGVGEVACLRHQLAK
ncbi:hypothetical protein C531_15781 [Pseudomonas aeruginosa SD9]|nr:hypothetical protein G655_00060 [Pseudomonas aeruginosa B136-33]OPF38493.1 hypothetical protein C531_15781 [Pseudomonas aeruginosa SD9]